ncbi:MAG: type II toxin-antitoxin system HicB family antitoxin [Candidatus Altiarchaeota archaeon]|nr:type II toxin-antitoxin system HicB family antitoxin [Candidatus Altiarchaeota archaeon]
MENKIVDKIFEFPVVIEKDKEGYFAQCPVLQGCYTQGDTYEEVLENLRDVIKLHIADRIEIKEEVPPVENIALNKKPKTPWKS